MRMVFRHEQQRDIKINPDVLDESFTNKIISVFEKEKQHPLSRKFMSRIYGRVDKITKTHIDIHTYENGSIGTIALSNIDYVSVDEVRVRKLNDVRVGEFFRFPLSSDKDRLLSACNYPDMNFGGMNTEALNKVYLCISQEPTIQTVSYNITNLETTPRITHSAIVADDTPSPTFQRFTENAKDNYVFMLTRS